MADPSRFNEIKAEEIGNEQQKRQNKRCQGKATRCMSPYTRLVAFV
jgi:hypothetical protein